MIRRMPAALAAAILLASLAAPSGLAAQSTTAPYFRTDLALAIGAKEFGPFNRVALGVDELVFTLAWNGFEGVGSTRGEESRLEYAPAYAYYRLDGKQLAVPAEAMAAGPFSSGRARFLEQDREALYGYLGTDGSWAIRPRFADATDFADGIAAAREPGGKWGTIGPDGKWLCVPCFLTMEQNPGRGLVIARREGEKESRCYDARTGAPVGQGDPRVSEPSRSEPDLYGGYTLREGRSAVVSGCDFANYTEIVSPGGKIVSTGVFTGVQAIRGTVAVVALGYYGDYWGDGPTSSSFSRSQGAFGLFDMASGEFIVPPNCSQILPVEGGLWYARPHGGSASLLDSTGKKIRSMPNFPILWISGAVSCGIAGRSSETLPVSQAVGEISISAAVNQDKVRMRSSPSLSGAIVTELSKGTRLSVREFKPAVETIGAWTGIWTRVETEDGQKGWVFGYFLDLYRYCQ